MRCLLVAARKVSQGRGRTLQTVLAALSLGNCPGFLYGGYALWVCWVNPESKALFEQGGVELTG